MNREARAKVRPLLLSGGLFSLGCIAIGILMAADFPSALIMIGVIGIVVAGFSLLALADF